MFKYKENYYMVMEDGSYRIRSHENVDGRGYSWFYVTDPGVITVLDRYLVDRYLEERA